MASRRDTEGSKGRTHRSLSIRREFPREPWRIRKLLPVKVEGAFAPSQPLSEALGLVSLPSYDGDATGQPSTHTQHVESKDDEFGTIVDEVTAVTSTVTTRKRYRIKDA